MFLRRTCVWPKASVGRDTVTFNQIRDIDGIHPLITNFEVKQAAFLQNAKLRLPLGHLG